MLPLAAGTLTPSEITVFLLALAVLLGAARLLGEIARKFGQPAVLGEILAGVLLGATVLANVYPPAYEYLFPKYLYDQDTSERVYYDDVDTETQGRAGEDAPQPAADETAQAPAHAKPAPSLVLVGLDAFSVLCVCLLLLVAGLEVDLSIVTRQGKAAGLVSITGMVVPFAFGCGLAFAVPGLIGYDSESGKLVPFALFLGIAMSITALPVIAKILLDLKMFRSDMGMLIMSSAMINDLLGWVGFAIVLSLILPPGESAIPLHFVIPATLVFVGLILTVGRWLADKAIPLVQAHTSWPGGILGFVFTVALLCAALTEWIGIHAIFGAFLAGVALGDSKHLKPQTRKTIEQIVTYIFAPIFFAGVALRVDFFDKGNFDLLTILLVLVVAIAGKALGCYAGAKWAGMSRRESWAVGFGMSARGAMEIILGQIALNYGLITEKLFVAIVIMAIVTSVIAGPMMQKALGLKQGKRLLDVLGSKNFAGVLRASTREAAIRELSEAASAVVELDADLIASAVIDRERLVSTGLANGIAVPHARLAHLKGPEVFVGISPPGLDFEASDGQPAEIICLLLTPEDDQRSQIELLRMVAEAFQTRATRRSVVEAEGYTQFRAALSIGSSAADAH
ncbi:MAG: cation:proton antiporter [Phycisphaerales bacterium JB063]